MADADEKVAWTGPVLRSCSVNGNELSLTFDDGRPSQVTHAIPLLDSFGVKATFYSQPKNLKVLYKSF